VPRSLPGLFSFRPLVTIEGTVGLQSTIAPGRGYLWFLFAASALTGIGWFLVPAFIIRPFHHQTPSALSLAMALRQRAPWPTLAAAALFCLLVALVLSSTASKSRKIILASAHSRNGATSKAFTPFWRSLSSAPVSGACVGPPIDRPTSFRKMVGSALRTFPKAFALVDHLGRQPEITTVILACRSTWKMRQSFRFVDLV
jgi:hypothetical protein